MKDTPLIRSAHNGHLQTVMYLVSQGADVDTIDIVRRRCTHFCVASRRRAC